MAQIQSGRSLCGIVFVLGLWSTAAVLGDEPRLPKYGPGTVRLFQAREYIRRNPAPDFWALLPYYLPQTNDSSCTVASVTMLVNALRADRELTSEVELATPQRVVEKVAAPRWRDKVADDGPGLTLDELAEIIPVVLTAYDLPRMRVESIHFSEDSPALRERLQRLLVEDERSDGDFLIANFLQSRLTGDPPGAVGHMAPLAAYDAENRRVLVLDPDRQWYEPYWVAEESLFEAMFTMDPVSQRSRGLIRVSRAP